MEGDLKLLKKLSGKNVRNLFFKNLYKIGYRYFNKEKFSKTEKLIIKSFQRRFLPNSVTGKIDQKTLKISQFLANNIKN